MKKSNNIQVYSTYSDLFGRMYDTEELKGWLVDLPMGGLLTVLSQMNFIDRDDKRIKKQFIHFLCDNTSGDVKLMTRKLENQVLYAPQGLLSVWKWILAYGDLSKITQEVEIDRGTFLVVYLNLIVSDYQYIDHTEDIEKLYYDLFTNMAFNSNHDIGSSLTRAALIYDYIAKNSDFFEKNEYMDINGEFEKKYGFSILEYLAIVQGIYASFQKEKNTIDPRFARGEDYFSKFKNHENIQLVLNELSMTLEEARNWALMHINEPWNFTKFKQKPLILLPNGYYIPISLKFLEEQAFAELFYKIRHCYGKEDIQVISFIGRCFEKYVDIISDKATNGSKLPYQYIGEFSYGRNKSPDCMIKLGTKLLAVEAKNYRLSMNSIVSNDKDSIEADIEKMINKPFKQLHSRIKELQDRKHNTMAGVEEIYLIVVTLGSVPTIPSFEKEIQKDFYGISELPIRCIIHMDIEEYEFLISVIGKTNSPSLFKVMDNKRKLLDFWPMKNFLLYNSYSRKRLDYIKIHLQQYFDKMGVILFQDEWDKGMNKFERF
ncbi:hypothetical protein D3C75_241870 [compost metagenome]